VVSEVYGNYLFFFFWLNNHCFTFTEKHIGNSFIHKSAIPMFFLFQNTSTLFILMRYNLISLISYGSSCFTFLTFFFRLYLWSLTAYVSKYGLSNSCHYFRFIWQLQKHLSIELYFFVQTWGVISHSLLSLYNLLLW